MDEEAHVLSLDDLRGFGISQLLPVDGEQASVGVEDDALAYLRRVREEASRIPLVISSAIDARAFDDNRTTAYLTNQDDEVYVDPPYPWMCQVVDDFLVARAQVAHDVGGAATAAASGLPPVTDCQRWKQMLAQASFQPFSTTLAHMDHALVKNCIDHLTQRLQTEHNMGEQAISHLGLWLYGLLVRLDKPVPSGLAATLRQLTQLARKRRPQASEQNADGTATTLVAIYDTLLVLAGGYFGQDPVLAPLVDEYVYVCGNS